MTDDDDKLFRRSMSDAKPLKAEERAAGPAKKPRPKARFTRADERAVLQESLDGNSGDSDELERSSGDALRFRRPSVGRTTMRMLARGNYAIQAELDLHGMTVAEARPRLQRFVLQCAGNGKLCIRIVHGKGLGSGERGPVLKRLVDRCLRRMDPVLAFTSTRQVDGGTGAVYVLLKPL